MDTSPASITDPWPVSPPQPPRGYIAESFGEFFSDRTWWVKALVGGLATAVPIIGAIAVGGYGLTWTRETAWGTDDGLPNANDLGRVLTVGGRAFLVRLVWGLPILIALGVFGGTAVALGFFAFRDAAPAVLALGIAGIGVALLAYTAIALVFGVLATLAALRATIYDRMDAGFSFRGIAGLYRRHPSGFWRAFGTSLLAGLAFGTVNFALSFAVTSAAALFGDYGATVSGAMNIVYLPVSGFLTFIATMIDSRAWGRWLREIDPRSLPPLFAPAAQVGSPAEQVAGQSPAPVDPEAGNLAHDK